MDKPKLTLREIIFEGIKKFAGEIIGVVKAQQEKHAQEAATQAQQKSGAELLRAVLEKYGPEDFFSASLNPKIFYDEKTNKPYIQVTENFNQTLFWDKFLPELRNAFDGVAVKKTKQFYEDNANQTLNKQGYFDEWSDYPYEFSVAEIYSVVIPNDASCTVYKMPFGGLGGQTELSYMKRILAADDAFFMLDSGRNFAVLSTEKYNAAHLEEGYEVELDSQELQRIDSMKFEVIFE